MELPCIHHLFERQVSQRPDHPALVSAQTYTYEALNRFANRIAHTIVAHELPKASRIALFFEQSASSIAAVLGALKSGNAYVAIDPTFPPERVAAIVHDAAVDVLLTTTEHWDTAQQLAGKRFPVINIEEIDPATCSDNLELSISPDALALIVYTSGSTGTPKGVMHCHRTIVHNFWRQWDLAEFQSSDRIALLYSTSVISSIRVTCNAFFAGATLYPFSIKAKGLLRFVELIQQEQLTVIDCIASLFRNLTSVLNGTEDLSSLRLAMMAGEATAQRDLQDFQRYFPKTCQFYVCMGSTEGATLCAQRLSHTSSVTTALIPPGYPLRDIQIKILDDAGVEVPLGVSGEIAIESDYLALGYWNRPDLNAFETIGATRQFKSGDIGRFLPDGRLVHQGRKDFQVKIRGFRVEVSEIEQVLLKSDVQDAIVVSPKSLGEAYLVAFVVPQPGVAVQIEQLRDLIRQSLPDYMMPRHFCVLNRLPRTPNGKIDRRALIGMNVQCDRTLATLPTTKLEQQLATIWCKALGFASIGIDEHFFDLGGHSLAMAQIVAQIEQEFAVQLPASALFEAPTLKQFARLIEQQAALETPLIPFRSHDRVKEPPLFCFPGAGDHFRFCQGLDRDLQAPRPIYGVREVSPYEYGSIEAMAGVYVQTILQAQPQGAYCLVGYSFGAIVALEVAQQLRAQGKTVSQLVLIDPAQPPIRLRALRHKIKQLPSRSWHKVYWLLYRLEVHWIRASSSQFGKLHYLQDRLRIHWRAAIAQRAKLSAHSTPDPVEQSFIERAKQFAIYFQLRDRYIAQPYDQPVTILLSEYRSQDYSYWANWRSLACSSRFATIRSCDHHSICEDPSIQEVTRLLESTIETRSLAALS